MKDDNKEMTILLVIRLIRYVNLEYRKYNIQNVKVDCKLSDLAGIKNFQKIKSFFNNIQVKVVDSQINISSIKIYIKN